MQGLQAGSQVASPGIYVLGIQTLVLTLGWQPQNHCFNTKMEEYTNTLKTDQGRSKNQTGIQFANS